MDGVEIVMAVEEAFDIKISNAEAEKMRTPRDLIEFVMAKVGRSDVAVCLTQRAFHRLRRAFSSELGIKRSDFQLDLGMDQLLPVATRKTLLPKIYQRAGVTESPKLELSRRLIVILLTASFVGGAGVWIVLSFAQAEKSSLLEFMYELRPLFGIGVGISLLIIGFRMSKERTTEFPRDLRTVRGQVRWLVANHPQLIGGPPGQWSREMVAEKVRSIVVHVLCCDNYREDARFVQDLGLS